MTQGPCLTEWFDEEYYPGPSEHDEIQFHVEVYVNAIRQFGKQLLIAELKIVESAFDGLVNTIKAFGPAVSYSYRAFSDIANEIADQVAPPPRRDQDQPAHITIHRNHGPYAGSGYDRRGRKRY